MNSISCLVTRSFSSDLHLQHIIALSQCFLFRGGFKAPCQHFTGISLKQKKKLVRISRASLFSHCFCLSIAKAFRISFRKCLTASCAQKELLSNMLCKMQRFISLPIMSADLGLDQSQNAHTQTIVLFLSNATPFNGPFRIILHYTHKCVKLYTKILFFLTSLIFISDLPLLIFLAATGLAPFNFQKHSPCLFIYLFLYSLNFMRISIPV